MALVSCKECAQEISDTASACPKCGAPIVNLAPNLTRPIGCGTLIILVLFFGYIASQFGNSPSHENQSAEPSSSSEAGATSATTQAQFALETISSACRRDTDSFIITEGSVENISPTTIPHVEAVAEYYDADGNMISSDSAITEYDPLLPGQTSAFKIISTYNPAIKKCGVGYKTPDGNTLLAVGKSEIVSRLQHGLSTLGFFIGKETGKAGPGTRAALRAFCMKEQIACDGTSDTWQLMQTVEDYASKGIPKEHQDIGEFMKQMDNEPKNEAQH